MSLTKIMLTGIFFFKSCGYRIETLSILKLAPFTFIASFYFKEVKRKFIFVGINIMGQMLLIKYCKQNISLILYLCYDYQIYMHNLHCHSFVQSWLTNIT